MQHILSLLFTLQTTTLAIPASPSTFDPSAYQPLVGHVLESLIPVLHARLTVLDPARVEEALEASERIELGDKIAEWWARRVAGGDGEGGGEKVMVSHRVNISASSKVGGQLD